MIVRNLAHTFVPDFFTDSEGTEEQDVSVTTQTNEGLGEIGKKKAIAAHAVVLLQKK